MTFSTPGMTSQHVAALEPIENYLQAHITGDAEYMRKAFHSDAGLVSTPLASAPLASAPHPS